MENKILANIKVREAEAKAKQEAEAAEAAKAKRIADLKAKYGIIKTKTITERIVEMSNNQYPQLVIIDGQPVGVANNEQDAENLYIAMFEAGYDPEKKNIMEAGIRYAKEMIISHQNKEAGFIPEWDLDVEGNRFFVKEGTAYIPETNEIIANIDNVEGWPRAAIDRVLTDEIKKVLASQQCGYEDCDDDDEEWYDTEERVIEDEPDGTSCPRCTSVNCTYLEDEDYYVCNDCGRKFKILE